MPEPEDDRTERARKFKVGIQTAIGGATVVGLAVSVVRDLDDPSALGSSADMTHRLLGGIGVGLAASAVIELAYTLVTPGPDEALDPVMLGVAASILLLVGGLEPDSLTLARAVALLALGVLLALLFAVRLFLAEVPVKEGSEEPKVPAVWWVRRLYDRK